MKSSIKVLSIIIACVMFLFCLYSCETIGVTDTKCNTEYYSFTYDKNTVSITANDLNRIYVSYLDNGNVDSDNSLHFEINDFTVDETKKDLEDTFNKTFDYSTYQWDKKDAYHTSFLTDQYNIEVDIISLNESKTLTITFVKDINLGSEKEEAVLSTLSPIINSVVIK